MPTVSTDAGAYQDLSTIRERVDYRGTDFFDDNAALRFDELLVRLERESRGIFVTLWGDESPLEETGRTDTIESVPDAAAMPLVYPIQDVTKVEHKVSLASDWEDLDTDWYDNTEHRLILARRPNVNSLRHRQRGNVLADEAERATWRDIAEQLRVTYDRGFSGGAPEDVKNIQLQMIQNALRSRKRDQTTSAGSPEELATATNQNEMLTEELRNRVSDVTKPGLATFSV